LRDTGAGWTLVWRVLLMVLGLIWNSGALAHTFLINTDPRPGTRFTTAPQVVSMQFSEAVDFRRATVTLRKIGSPAVRLAPLRPGAGGVSLIAPLPALTSGVFVVAWAALADDGHPSSGTFAFAVGSAGVVPVLSDTPDGLPLPWVGSSALLLLGLVLALGGWISERFIWTGRVRPAAMIGPGASLGVLGSLWHLGLVTSGPDGHLVMLMGRSGILALLTLLSFLLSGVMARQSWRRWAGLPLGIAAVGVALQGHVGLTGVFWSTPLGLAHLLLAVLWAGTLVHLVQVLWSSRAGGWTGELTRGLARYAVLAAWTVGPLIVLGTLLAWSQFAVVQELWTTRYGQLLLVKTGGVTLALGLALLARRRVRSVQEARCSACCVLKGPCCCWWCW
jgi:copper transport protein